MTAQPITDPLLMAPDPGARANEVAAIGCCLLADMPEVRGEVLDHVADTDFLDRNCRVAVKLVRQLVTTGEAVNVATLRAAAERNGVTLREEFLTELAVELPDPWRARSYVQAIRDARLCRDLLGGARKVASLSAGGELDGAQVALRELLQAMDEQRESNDVLPLSHHFATVLASLDRPMGSAMGITTGLPKLDQLTLGLQPGQFWVIAGRPGMGKSALALGMAREASFRCRKSVAYFSLEMSATEQARRILAAEAGVALKNLRGNYLNGTQRHDLQTTANSIGGWDLVLDDTGCLDVDELERRAHSLHRVYGLSMVIVDYLQLVDVEGRSREQEVAKLSRKCKGLARSLNIPVVALCQLSRECEKRPDKRPMLHDLRESGSLEQDCDVAMLLYREGYYNKEADQERAEIIVAKQRDGETDIIYTRFDGARVRFLP